MLAAAGAGAFMLGVGERTAAPARPVGEPVRAAVETEKPRSLTAVAGRVWERLGNDNLTLIAAGVAFYALLAIFPAFAAFVSVYGLVADLGAVQRQIAELATFMPAEAAKLLTDALEGLIGKGASKLNLGLIVGLGLTLWSARAGMGALMTGLNVAYECDEKRSFLMQQAVALGLTAGAIVFAGVTLLAVAAVPVAIGLLPLAEEVKTVLSVARWPLLAVVVMIGFAALYAFAPSRRELHWRWLSWGAGVATILWIAGSALFSAYVSQFGSYDATYGALGAVVVLLLWFWLTALVTLLGAEINAVLEPPARPAGPEVGRSGRAP